MKQLTKQLVQAGDLPAEIGGRLFDELPERVVQIGEGNFLRGFIDWMIHEMNKQGLFNGRVIAIQPTPHGKVVPKLNQQEGLYTLSLRGIEAGQAVDQLEVISSISRGINPYENWEEVLLVAENPQVQFMFSNTTEAGLTYTKEAYDGQTSPLSFPAKVTAYLYHRYLKLGATSEAGMFIFPCELVEGNGDLLREYVLQHATDWDLPQAFIAWVKRENHFCNTLVDRIVPGYPKDNIKEFEQKMGYTDQLLVVGEPYHLFAIEAPEQAKQALPFHQAGLNVYWEEITPYRELKVRILNGAHTMSYAAAYLLGNKTVYEMMNDKLVARYIQKGIENEILPVLSFEEEQKRRFAASVVERFENPFFKHYLLDLGMNAVYKWRTRVLPTLLDWVHKEGKVPEILSFSLAALIRFYRPIRIEGTYLIGEREGEEYTIRDNPETLLFFESQWQSYHQHRNINQLVEGILQESSLWGLNLADIPDLGQKVAGHVKRIQEEGIFLAMDHLLKES